MVRKEDIYFRNSLLISIYITAADFMLDTTMASFNSSSVVGDQRCFVFDPVQDTIVEDDELMTFDVMAANELDGFSTSNFTLTIRDDDGEQA